MTPDDHQRERMRHWSRAFNLMNECRSFGTACDVADAALAEFDKRFPAPSAISEPGSVDELVQWAKRAPSAAAPVEPVAAGYKFSIGPQIAGPELASLRQKARLWDAVASGKVCIEYYESGFYASWAHGNRGSGAMATAEEAVEAAIAAGATKWPR